MTPLRQRRIEDLPLRGRSERTQALSVRAVRHLAAHCHTSPDQITEEALRDSFLSLKNVTHSSRAASPIALCGITWCSEQTLQRAWTTLSVVRAPREQQLPVVLSLDAVRTMLAHGKLLRSRVCLTTLSSCGLRLQEGTHLPGPESARARRLVHVRCGTGAQDRSVPLPSRTLASLRHAWATHRHPLWRLPAPGRSGLGLPTASAPRPSTRVQDAFRAALTARGLHTRASVHTLRHSDATPLLAAGGPLRLIHAAVGHHAPTTTALSTHLPSTADAMAREAPQGLLAAIALPEEGCDGRGGRHRAAPWTRRARPRR
jgi:integrase/recombinase XerD